MPKVSQAKAAITRQNIINASLKICYEEGVINLTFSRIAQMAGTSRSGINAHFKRKEDIIDEMRPIIMSYVYEHMDFSSPEHFVSSYLHMLENDKKRAKISKNCVEIIGGVIGIQEAVNKIKGDPSAVKHAVLYIVGYLMTNDLYDHAVSLMDEKKGED